MSIRLTEKEYEKCFERAFGVDMKQVHKQAEINKRRLIGECSFFILCIVLGVLWNIG